MPHEAPQRNLDEIWASLSEEEQKACLYFCVGDWSSGYGIDDLKAMDIGDGQLSSLIDKGIVQKGTLLQYAQELMDRERVRYQEIRARMKVDLLADFQYTDEEIKVVNDYDRRKSIVQGASTTKRYRLLSQKFHDWVKSEFSKNKVEVRF